MFTRLRNAAAVMRPRTLARMAARVEKLDVHTAEALQRVRQDVHTLREQARADGELLRQQTRTSDAIARQITDLSSSIETLTTTVASMHESLQRVELRAEQLTAIARADAAEAPRLEQLPAVLQADRARAHVARSLERCELRSDPFPHVVVDDFLPPDVYDAMIKAIPPRVLFEDRQVNKQQIPVPPRFAPEYSRRVWRFIVNEVVEREMKPGILAKFRAPLTEYLQRFWPGLQPDDPNLAITGSDGRIILRRAGYVIPPHRDPRWGWLTAIVYLARPGDPETWGTQLYRVRDDVDAPSAQPYWIGDSRCELVGDVPFRANRALIFLNSDGAHGASIPVDAPPDFERYIYQSRIGPNVTTMRAMMAKLTPEARAAWEGKDGY